MAMEGLKGTFYADGANADAEKTWRHMPGPMWGMKMAFLTIRQGD